MDFSYRSGVSSLRPPRQHWLPVAPGPGLCPAPIRPGARGASSPWIAATRSNSLFTFVEIKMISELYRQAVLCPRLPVGCGWIQSGDPSEIPVSREPFQPPNPCSPPRPSALAATVRYPRGAGGEHGSCQSPGPGFWEKPRGFLICRRVGGCGRAGGPGAAAPTPSHSPCPASAP